MGEPHAAQLRDQCPRFQYRPYASRLLQVDVRLVKTRFSPEAADKLRTAIREAGGVEVFAVGRMGLDQLVADLEVHCRGNRQSVPALLRTPRPGEVVIHNHPSGVLEASPADMHLKIRVPKPFALPNFVEVLVD